MLLLLGVLSPAISHAEIKVTDVLGRERVLKGPPQRVLLGFYFEDFLAIVGPKAYDRVVGITKATWKDWRNLQWAAYTKVIPGLETIADMGGSDNQDFNLELALSLKPDVAIMAAWQYEALGERIGRLEAAGVPVLVVDYNSQTVPLHVASTLVIGKVMGSEDRASALAKEYEAAVADVLARVKKAGQGKTKVYVELGNKGADEYGNSYTNNMWGSVITTAGGHNIADGVLTSKWGPLNPEYVLSQNPEVIFIGGGDWVKGDKPVLMGLGVSQTETRARLKPFTARAGWSSMPAVKSRQVHAIYHGGARTLYDFTFLQYIAKTLHPHQFMDVNPVENHRRFYERYLPIKAEGTFMTSLE